eukprot:778518-Amphidinium_carterae.3
MLVKNTPQKVGHEPDQKHGTARSSKGHEPERVGHQIDNLWPGFAAPKGNNAGPTEVPNMLS